MLNNIDNKTLYIIGNGFDLRHGVKSSYYEFRDFMKEQNKSMNYALEIYFDCENFWGEFEKNLAFLSADKVMKTVDSILDIYMDIFEEDPNDFTYDNYTAAIDIGIRVVNDLTVKLPNQFKEWINSLDLRKEKMKKLENLIKKDGLYINFNYTEFLESIYEVPEENILYIHGDRRQDEELILGHGRDPRRIYGFSYDTQYKDNISSFEELELRSKSKPTNPIKHFAADYVANRIREYFYANTKKTRDIIEDNIDFFENLRFVEVVYVIGHSLSQVDHPYFIKIMESNKSFKKLKWKISYYEKDGMERIKENALKMGIAEEDMELFKL